jgi:hypothetical protein
MYDFLLQTILFLSLGVVIYLLARAVPRVTESGEVIHAPGRFDRLLTKLPLRKIDERLNTGFAKALRTMKVWVMKSGNVLDERMARLKARAEAHDEKTESANLFEKLNDDKSRED